MKCIAFFWVVCWVACTFGVRLPALDGWGWGQAPVTTAAGIGDIFADGGRIRGGRKNYWVSLEARIFFSHLSGFMEYENKGTASPTTPVVGDHLDFVKDLGIEPDRALLIPEISVNLYGQQVLRASYFSLEDTAHGRLERTFVFGGNQYTVNDDIDSDFYLRVLRIRYEFGLFSFMPVNLVLGMGADAIWVHAHITDNTAGTDLDTGHRSGGVPILELRTRINLPYGVGFEGHIEGMHVGLGWVGRGSVGLDWQILRFISFQGGYQLDYVGINMRELNGVRAGSRLAGAFGSVTVWF